MGVNTNVQFYNRFNDDGSIAETIQEISLGDGKGFIRKNLTTQEVTAHVPETTEVDNQQG